MLLHRHFQWLTTSSTLVYCVSKMSDYSQAQVARLVGLQGTVIVAGTMATLMTSWFKCKPKRPSDHACLLPAAYPVVQLLCSACKSHARLWPAA